MNITKEKYQELLKYAHLLANGSHIDPRDLLHDLLLSTAEPSPKKLKNAYYAAIREYRLLNPYAPSTGIDFKVCSRCKLPHPIAAFQPIKGTPWHQSKCLPCEREYAAEYRANNRDKLSKWQKRYSASAKGQAKAKRAAKKRKPTYAAYLREWRKKKKQAKLASM